MQTSLEHDLRRLAGLAYHRLESCGELVRELHRLRKAARQHPDFPALEEVAARLFIPFTFWPVDFQSLCAKVERRIAAGDRLTSDLRLLIGSLPELPSEKAQAVAAAHEREVQQGDYGAQVNAGEKYVLMEEKLLADPRFWEGWAALQVHYAVAEFRDSKGIIRRRMVAERGFRTEWEFDWDDPAARFRAAFDIFCHRWDLYGMEGDRPLLMKLTVNLTPHGTMILIPSWWSFDYGRDLNWPEIRKLHNARVRSNQGPKLLRNQMDQAAEAERAARLDAEAKAMGLKGERRADWVMEQLKWAVRDSRKLRRVLSRAKPK